MRAGFFIILVFACVFASPSAAFDGMQRKLNRLFQKAILKVDVSGEVPQFNADGEDVCQSQGMGFLISRTHLISAKHVLDVSDACRRRIVVSSAATSFQSAADVMDSYGDVVLLKLRDGSAPAPICSLALSPENIYDQPAVRFALPAPLIDPEPLLTEVGEEGGQFEPNVRITPAPVHPGDSGGPIIHFFSVIGITKEKLTHVDGYGVMVPVDPINTLLKRAAFRPDGSTCNPLLTQQTAIDVTFYSDVLEPEQIKTGLETAITGLSLSFNRIGDGGATVASAQTNDNRSVNIPGVGPIMLPPLEDLARGPASINNGGGLGNAPFVEGFSSGSNSEVLNLELPRLPGEVAVPKINPAFGTITLDTDQQGVAVLFGRDYPKVATEFLEESLKSQMWTEFINSLPPPSSP